MSLQQLKTRPENNWEKNIGARRAALALIELAATEAESDKVNGQRFWEIIAAHAAERCSKVLVDERDLPPMDSKEQAEFEAREVPRRFTAFAGQSVREVDPGYWLLMMGERDDFTRQLRRYMRTKRFLDLQGDEDEG